MQGRLNAYRYSVVAFTCCKYGSRLVLDFLILCRIVLNRVLKATIPKLNTSESSVL